MKESLHLDTAVIGGGITGLYTCMELHKHKGPDHRMALFEASDRFGGRIETVEMDGFLAEFGPMRFETKSTAASYAPYPGFTAGDLLFSPLHTGKKPGVAL